MKMKTWCPQCGPDVDVDGDGRCSSCGCVAIGKGVDYALRLREGLSIIRHRYKWYGDIQTRINALLEKTK